MKLLKFILEIFLLIFIFEMKSLHALCNFSWDCSWHGSCFGGFCNCNIGYYGDKCQYYIPAPVAPCSKVNCLNGGTCVPNGNSASCNCLLGWTGARCETSDSNTRSYQVLVGSTYSIKWGSWGNWGPIRLCPKSTYVIGYQTKLEWPMNGDDTALNGIKLMCSNGEVISSLEGPWGAWSEFKNCQNNVNSVGFIMKVEPIQGKGDDTATNGFSLICSDGFIVNNNEGPWGFWTPHINCNPGYKVCGIQTQVEPNQYSGDDTALNNINIYCCND